MHFGSKLKTLALNPRMWSAYGRWAGAKLAGGKPRLALPGGARIGEWVSFSEYWSFQQIMPEPERRFVERRLAGGPEAIAFDIGANVGVFTCLMARLGHTVHAFEPVPDTFCRLKANVKFNRLLERVRLNCLALGQGPGLVTFQIQELSAATNRIIGPADSARHSAASTQLVAVTSLDEYCRRQGVERVDFVKLDVEGMEPQVLQGAKGLLRERRIGAILIEICPANLRAAGWSPADLWREFESARYFPHELNPDGGAGAPLSFARIEAMSLENVALLPDA